ncbi:MAG: hypothetical protein AAF355_08790 [Myxococcota bacterium]
MISSYPTIVLLLGSTLLFAGCAKSTTPLPDYPVRDEDMQTDPMMLGVDVGGSDFSVSGDESTEASSLTLPAQVDSEAHSNDSAAEEAVVPDSKSGKDKSSKHDGSKHDGQKWSGPASLHSGDAIRSGAQENDTARITPHKKTHKKSHRR